MSKKEVKIYHVETQEDYDDLMIELEEQGYKWPKGDKPTARKYWYICKEETVISLNEVTEHELHFGLLKHTKREYPEIPIIKHKAKGVKQMEKVVVPQFVADWYEKRKTSNLYALLGKFSNEFMSGDQNISEWAKRCEGRNLFRYENAQEVIAKMHLYGYEVEEEKKYYWRKKKEYMFSFENRVNQFLNIGSNGVYGFGNNTEIARYRTKLTETEVRRIVSEEDFNKLEKVEITE